MSLIKFERQQHILREIERSYSVSLAMLQSMLSTPKLTIQRDLIELEKAGMLKRVHGGAVRPQGEFIAIPKKIREKTNVAAKERIARKAAEFIGQSDTVCIDSSTTCALMSEFIPDYGINVITPSIDLFSALAGKKNCMPILTGGTHNRRTQTLIGSFTEQFIKKFSFSLCFISADGFDSQRGTLEFDVDDSIVKKAMIEVSRKVILLIDSRKMSIFKGILTCPSARIDVIITDKTAQNSLPSELPKEIVKKIITV